MKRHLLIFAMLLGAVSSWGQSQDDLSSVLGKCLQLPQVTQYYKLDITGAPETLYALKGDVIPSDAEISYSGKKLNFVNQQNLGNVDYYFQFTNLAINETTARVSFDFWFNCKTSKKSLSVILELKKQVNEWVISDTKITRR